jgi:hypothetical protein
MRVSAPISTYLLASAYLGTGGSGQGGRSLTTSLKGAGYRSLGSLARNALLSNFIEILCWPLEGVLDRSEPQTNIIESLGLPLVPWLNRALAGCVGASNDMAIDTYVQLGWYLSWLCGALERYNRGEFH